MTELQRIQANIDKWAKISYAVIALVFVVSLAGYLLDELSSDLLLGALGMAVYVLFAAQKKSRVVAIVIILSSGIDCIDYALISAGYAPFVAEVVSSNGLAAVFSLFNGAMLALGFLIGVEAQKFHALVESRIVFKNTVLRVLVTLGYVIVAIVIVVLLSEPYGYLPEEHVSQITTGLWLAIIFLAMWRKLPGTGRFPTVVWGDEAKENPKSIAVGESLMTINRLANTQKDGDGNFIVSPGGVFAKSYGLSADQFAAYQDWHKKWFKVGWKPVFVFVVFFILYRVIVSMLAEPWGDYFTYGILGGLAVFVVSLQLKQLRDFRHVFPDAPIAKRQGGTLKRVIFAIASAPIIGTYAYAVLAIVFGPLFLLPLALSFSSVAMDLSLWIVVLGAVLGGWMIVLGIGIIYARYTFKKRHNRPLTAEALADVQGLN